MDLVEAVNRFSLLLIAPIIGLAVLFYLHGKDDFKDIFVRSVFAILVITFSKELLVPSVNFSFEYTDQMLRQSNSYRNFFNWQKRIHRYHKARSNASSEGDSSMGTKESKSIIQFVGESLSNYAAEYSTKIITFVLWIFSFLCLSILRVLYSYVYHLFFLLVGFGAVLSIARPMTQILQGLLKTYLWLLITPFLTGISILIVGNELIEFGVSGLDGDFSLMKWSKFMFASLMVLFTPVISSAFISGAGAHSVSHAISNTAGMAFTLGSSRLLSNQIKSKAGLINNIAKSKGGGIVNRGINEFKNRKSDSQIPVTTKAALGEINDYKGSNKYTYMRARSLVNKVHGNNFNPKNYSNEEIALAAKMIEGRKELKDIPSNFNSSAYKKLKKDTRNNYV